MAPSLWSQHYGPSAMVPALWPQRYGPSAMVPVAMIPALWSQRYGSQCYGPSTMVPPHYGPQHYPPAPPHPRHFAMAPPRYGSQIYGLYLWSVLDPAYGPRSMVYVLWPQFLYICYGPTSYMAPFPLTPLPTIPGATSPHGSTAYGASMVPLYVPTASTCLCRILVECDKTSHTKLSEMTPLCVPCVPKVSFHLN